LLLSDPELAIDWQVPADLRIISAKDTRHPLLRDLDNPF
jgi:dTDP-4-dehydrorhamnose 3,5-epimerase